MNNFIKKIKKIKIILNKEGARFLLNKIFNLAIDRFKRTIAIRMFKIFGHLNISNDEEYRLVSNDIFRISSKDIEKSKLITDKHSKINVHSATWFVPYFNHLAFGGIYTIFRFINYMVGRGIECNLVIYDRPDINVDDLKQEIVKEFSDLEAVNIIIFNQETDNIEDLPYADISFCTFWVSAYFLLRYNQTKRKYYFIQDYEPSFYEGGSTYALAESTYRFCFRGVVNTPGLLKAVNSMHGLEGISFTPAVEKKFYYPRKKKTNGQKTRIFFYARPSNPRNAFFLGLDGLA